MFTITVNNRQYSHEKDIKLLTFLREELNLTSVKNACGEGVCGACTVLVDGKAMRACTLSLSRLEGKSVVTLEGLGDDERMMYAECFATSGAVQCGFCIPGMIMSAKALLDVNPTPKREDIKKALRGNICRCTGYVKIEDAVLLAAKCKREGKHLDSDVHDAALGMRFMRVDAIEKAVATGLYTDDLRFEGMVYGKCLRSAYPRARVLKIDTSEAEKDDRCVKVFTYKDVPLNKHGHLVQDWPVFIAEGELTHYMGDAIALAVSDEEEALDEIISKIKVDYEELEGVYDVKTAARGENIVHEEKSDNILSKEHIVRGHAEEMLKKSAYTVKQHYSTPATEHAFMEPECAIGMYDEKTGGVLVYTSGQSIYDERREISNILSLPQEKVRCVSALVGGGFGGKEDMSVQHHAALAGYFLRRPVKVKLSRNESLLVHPKRHPMEIDLELGCDDEGILTALVCDIDADTGAYASLGGPVLQRACTHAAGPYNYQNIKIQGVAYYTNNVPAGAFRGFGVTQSIFALESALDLLADKAHLDPFEIRMKNALKPGDIMPNGQIASPDTGIRECLESVKDVYYNTKHAGIACAIKNSGVGVGVPDTGRCILAVVEGKVHIRTSAACMGQGLATVTTQIIHEVTGLSPDLLFAERPDTAFTPDSGTSTASRQTAFTGEATRRAAVKLYEALKVHSLEELEGQSFFGEFTFNTDPITSENIHPVSHLAYSYSAQVVALSDEGKIKKITAACDAGRVINRSAIEGQIEGGVVMGMGFALKENFIQEEGRVKSKYATLGLLRATDVPEIEVRIAEGEKRSPYAFGAKGVGELCTIPTAPAINNAYYHFDGKIRTKLPLEHTAYSK